MDVIDRARLYVAKLDGAVSGSGGHNTTIHVACVLVKGFGLSEGEAMGLMREWNVKCAPAWSEGELLHKVRSAARMPDDKPRGFLLGSGGDRTERAERTDRGVGAVVQPRPRRLDYDAGALKGEQLPGLRVSREWLRERSPVDPWGVGPAEFLSALYEPGERVLCFLSQWSQGDYGFVKGERDHRWVKLAGNREGKDERLASGEPPAGLLSGREGVWFLAQPVDGKWHLDERNRDRTTGLPKYGRRSEVAVTSWRWMVLESDDAPEGLWLNFLAQFRMPIAALYTSGGRSIHALVRVDAKSKQEWDYVRDAVRPVMSKLGADPAAMTAVRLTRLPGCLRRGKMRRDGDRNIYTKFEKPLNQELLWLNPGARAGECLMDMPVMRRGGGA